MFGAIGELAKGILDRIIPNRAEANASQSRINEAEVSGAPASRLRLWRSFLGWVLALAFSWEIIGRTVILTYWPDVKLPPSVLKEISTLLMGMLGLGW